jgi:hypothetical protein
MQNGLPLEYIPITEAQTLGRYWKSRSERRQMRWHIFELNNVSFAYPGGFLAVDAFR